MCIRDSLEASGMALVLLVSFTPEVAALPPETFVRRVLLDTLNMRELLIGHDFTLGKGRSGTPEVLTRIGKAEGFRVDRLEALSVHDEVVSSTRIRDLSLIHILHRREGPASGRRKRRSAPRDHRQAHP